MFGQRSVRVPRGLQRIRKTLTMRPEEFGMKNTGREKACESGGARAHPGGRGSGLPAAAQQKPNIILIVSDDTGYGDLGPYGGGEGRGMPTPNIDRLANEGMTVLLLLRPAELHAGPRRDADRPHSQSQRHDHRGLPGSGRRSARGGMDARLRCSRPAATRPSSPASGTWARPTTRCPTPRATTR